jgi:hydroxymethylbilane synthase
MLPIALRADGRRAVIVGGGNVALRKAEALRQAGFAIALVAPRIDPRLHALLDTPNATIDERAYERGDLDGAAIAIAATDSPEINARVIADARAASVLACDAIDPENGDFTMQATVRVGELTFTVDSGRSSPAFAQRIARELRERFGDEYDRAARYIARMRSYARVTLPPEDRIAMMRDLSERPIDELARMSAVQVVCASRASALAMKQTRMVAAALAQRSIATTILNVTTTGDRETDRPISALGSTNVWVKELETALLDGRADYAVHSCKDLPGTLAPGMTIAAISAREDARDAFCSERFASFDELPAGAVVGTSSERRRAQLRALRADLRYEHLRGNIDTRLRKLREGAYDAIVLAMAGLNRLGIGATHTVPFDPDTIVPAVAQGALAIETLETETTLAAELRAAIEDEPARLCIEAERAVLRALRAGCSAPLGVHALLDDMRRMTIVSAYEVDGTIVRERIEGAVASVEEARALGEKVATALASHRSLQA